jgi:hypothetical protein
MLAPIVNSPIQRFTQSNLTSCGWFLHRLVAKYPVKNEIGWANYIRSMCDRNDCLFIAQPHAVALAEVVQTDTLAGKRVVQERFVWCENRLSAEQVEAAADFYDEFHRWAASLGIEEIVVAKETDVPTEMIKARLGKVYVTETRHVKV